MARNPFECHSNPHLLSHPQCFLYYDSNHASRALSPSSRWATQHRNPFSPANGPMLRSPLTLRTQKQQKTTRALHNKIPTSPLPTTQSHPTRHTLLFEMEGSHPLLIRQATCGMIFPRMWSSIMRRWRIDTTGPTITLQMREITSQLGRGSEHIFEHVMYCDNSISKAFFSMYSTFIWLNYCIQSIHLDKVACPSVALIALDST